MPLRLSSPILAAGLGASPVICTSTRTMDARVAAFSEPPRRSRWSISARARPRSSTASPPSSSPPAGASTDCRAGGASASRSRGASRCARDFALAEGGDGIAAEIVGHRYEGPATQLRLAPRVAADCTLSLHASGPAPAPAMPIAVAVHDGWVLPQAARPDRPKPAQAMARSCAGEPPAISAPAATAICAEAGPAPPPAVSRHAVSRSAARSPCPGTPSTRAPSSR